MTIDPSPDLLHRAHAELDEAATAADPVRAFLHAHMAALRAAAVLTSGAAALARARRRPVRSVWEQLAAQGPAWESWAALFERSARLRAALETGRLPDVEPGEVAAALERAQDFVDLVGLELAARAQGAPALAS